MLIERTPTEIIIKLPLNVDIEGDKGLLDYLIYKEATANFQASQTDVDTLSKQVKKGWWRKNRSRFI